VTRGLVVLAVLATSGATGITACRKNQPPGAPLTAPARQSADTFPSGARANGSPTEPAAAGGTRAETAAPHTASLPEFWKRFRQAALARDAEAAASLARFPFRTRGELDSDPWVSHPRGDFAALFLRLLAQDTGLTAMEESTADLIARTKSLDETGKGHARLASLVFERVDGSWTFTAAYLSD
jgi:hypothetical protein